MKKIIILIMLNVFLCWATYSKTYNIAVIPKGTSHDFWNEIKMGALKAQKEFGVKIEYRGPNNDGDTDSQIKLVETFIQKKVDAIVLAPNHKTALIPVVKKAIKSGIKVIIIDSSLDGDYYESFIATDNFAAGKLAGEKLAKLVGSNGKVGLIRFKVGNASTEMREEGFIEVMKEKNIEVIVDEYGGVTIGSAYRKGLEIFSKKPKLTGFFTTNETATIGIEKALIDNKLSGKIFLIGFDINKEIEKGIATGSINGVIVQDPQLMGYLGVKAAFDVLQGKKVEKKIIVKTSYKGK